MNLSCRAPHIQQTDRHHSGNRFLNSRNLKKYPQKRDIAFFTNRIEFSTVREIVKFNGFIISLNGFLSNDDFEIKVSVQLSQVEMVRPTIEGYYQINK